jgi:DNA-directed RNA polymerase I, II, and III subunit RPABC3
VSRIQGTAQNTNAELTLDIAPELYAIAAGETFTLALAKSLVQDELELNGDGEEDGPKKVKRELWRSEDQGLAADYEYVMYGKVCLFFFLGAFYAQRIMGLMG